jgi:hypothetical protein
MDFAIQDQTEDVTEATLLPVQQSFQMPVEFKGFFPCLAPRQIFSFKGMPLLPSSDPINC